jgi:ABC-2 type transport system ATP-binding protein
VSLVDVLGEIGSDHDLKDVALEEPGIEEVIRTFYQGRNALAAN